MTHRETKPLKTFDCSKYHIITHSPFPNSHCLYIWRKSSEEMRHISKENADSYNPEYILSYQNNLKIKKAFLDSNEESLIILGSDKILSLFTLKSLALSHYILLTKNPHKIVLNNNRTLLILSFGDGSLYSIDATALRILQHSKPSRCILNDLVFSLDGSFLAAINNKTLFLWFSCDQVLKVICKFNFKKLGPHVIITPMLSRFLEKDPQLLVKIQAKKPNAQSYSLPETTNCPTDTAPTLRIIGDYNTHTHKFVCFLPQNQIITALFI